MMRLTEYFVVALIYSAQVIVQLHAVSSDQTFASTKNGTTTAIPPHNVSLTSGHAPSGTTSIPTVATFKDSKQFTTTATADSKTSDLSNLTTIDATTVGSASTGIQQEMGYRYDKTTAAPPSIGPVPVSRHFDALSFTGGALLALCLVIIGTMVWKMYIAHVERRYWTL